MELYVTLSLTLFLSLSIRLCYSYDPATCIQCRESHMCNPPECFCCRDKMPLNTRNIPQMVFFSFDDAVNPQVAKYYKKLFNSKRVNPNGCPISMTLFVSHRNTVYSLVKEFYQKGMEIASHSVTHSHMNKNTFIREARKQKENLSKRAGIPTSKITGWRSPFLEPVGDLQPSVLKDLGYEYDATLTITKKDPKDNAITPFTLDFGWPYDCKIKPCPTRAHKGFWEVPVVSVKDYLNKYDCVYVDGCNNPPPTENLAYKFLWDNFQKYYTTNRAPMGINMHASWFYYPDRKAAMDRFIKQLVKLDDVYIISIKQVIEWLKKPTSLEQIKTFQPWQCNGNKTSETEIMPLRPRVSKQRPWNITFRPQNTRIGNFISNVPQSIPIRSWQTPKPQRQLPTVMPTSVPPLVPNLPMVRFWWRPPGMADASIQKQQQQQELMRKKKMEQERLRRIAAEEEKARLLEQKRQDELRRQEQARLLEQKRQEKARQEEQAKLLEQQRQEKLRQEEQARILEQQHKEQLRQQEQQRLFEQKRKEELRQKEQAKLLEQQRQEKLKREEKAKLIEQQRQEELRQREQAMLLEQQRLDKIRQEEQVLQTLLLDRKRQEQLKRQEHAKLLEQQRQDELRKHELARQAAALKTQQETERKQLEEAQRMHALQLQKQQQLEAEQKQKAEAERLKQLEQQKIEMERQALLAKQNLANVEKIHQKELGQKQAVINENALQNEFLPAPNFANRNLFQNDFLQTSDASSANLLQKEFLPATIHIREKTGGVSNSNSLQNEFLQASGTTTDNLLQNEFLQTPDIANTNALQTPSANMDNSLQNEFLQSPEIPSMDLLKNEFIQTSSATDAHLLQNEFLQAPAAANVDLLQNEFLQTPVVSDVSLLHNEFLQSPDVANTNVLQNEFIQAPSTKNAGSLQNEFFQASGAANVDLLQNEFLQTPAATNDNLLQNEFLQAPDVTQNNASPVRVEQPLIQNRNFQTVQDTVRQNQQLQDGISQNTFTQAPPATTINHQEVLEKSFQVYISRKLDDILGFRPNERTHQLELLSMGELRALQAELRNRLIKNKESNQESNQNQTNKGGASLDLTKESHPLENKVQPVQNEIHPPQNDIQILQNEIQPDGKPLMQEFHEPSSVRKTKIDTLQTEQFVDTKVGTGLEMFKEPALSVNTNYLEPYVQPTQPINGESPIINETFVVNKVGIGVEMFKDPALSVNTNYLEPYVEPTQPIHGESPIINETFTNIAYETTTGIQDMTTESVHAEMYASQTLPSVPTSPTATTGATTSSTIPTTTTAQLMVELTDYITQRSIAAEQSTASPSIITRENLNTMTNTFTDHPSPTTISAPIIGDTALQFQITTPSSTATAAATTALATQKAAAIPIKPMWTASEDFQVPWQRWVTRTPGLKTVHTTTSRVFDTQRPSTRIQFFNVKNLENTNSLQNEQPFQLGTFENKNTINSENIVQNSVNEMKPQPTAFVNAPKHFEINGPQQPGFFGGVNVNPNRFLLPIVAPVKTPSQEFIPQLQEEHSFTNQETSVPVSNTVIQPRTESPNQNNILVENVQQIAKNVGDFASTFSAAGSHAQPEVTNVLLQNESVPPPEKIWHSSEAQSKRIPVSGECIQEVNCMRPDCVCKSTNPPDGIKLETAPQIVYITIDGSLNFHTYGKMRSLFSRGRVNPNGCRITGTVFITDTGSSYRIANVLKKDGIELAMMGASSRPYTDSAKLKTDLLRQRKRIAASANINFGNVKGWRSPGLSPLGDEQYKTLANYSMYDASLLLPTNTMDTPIPWPYTLDFGWKDTCQMGKCPQKYHNGVWEIPAIPFHGPKNLTTCEYIDACTNQPETEQQTIDYLMKNFNEYYKTNRAPFAIRLKQMWFHWYYRDNFSGLLKFLDKILQLGDVYVTSVSNMLEWMKTPKSLKDIKQLDKWKC